MKVSVKIRNWSHETVIILVSECWHRLMFVLMGRQWEVLSKEYQGDEGVHRKLEKKRKIRVEAMSGLV